MADRMEMLLEAERRGILPQPKLDLLNEARRRGLVPAVAAPEPVVEPVSGDATEQAEAPTTAEIFDLDPNIKQRSTLVPTAVGEGGKTVFSPSDLILEAMEILTLPGRVLKGHAPTEQEMLNFTAALIGNPLNIGKKAAIAVPDKAAAAASDAAGAALDDALKAAEAGAPNANIDDLKAAARAARDLLRDKPQVTEGAQTIARQKRFEAQGIPASRGDVTQDFGQQAQESRLIGLTDEDAQPFRQFRLEQSQAFESRANDLVDSLGVPSETGEKVKDALSGRIKLLRKDKNDLYREVAESSPELANAPIITDDIAAAMPDADTLEDIAIVGANVDGINKALVRFGINKNPADVEAFIDGGGTITPLTLGNFDRFRKLLSGLEKADQTGSASVAIGPIRRALDEEAALIDDAVRASGVTDQSIVNTLKEARARVRTLKTEFSPQAIAGRLTATKQDGFTPIIEASKVSDTLLKPKVPIENLQRTLASLRNAGKKGQAAIGDLQASVINDALDAALKAPSRKTSGIETIGGNQFAKALDKFGDDKLDLLFKNNPEALKALRDLKQTALDITPTARAVPKGSADVILDLINRSFSVPGLAAARDVVNNIVKAGADERAVRKAMDSTSPAVLQGLRAWSRRYGAIASRLGVLSAIEAFDAEPKAPVSLSDLEDIA